MKITKITISKGKARADQLPDIDLDFSNAYRDQVKNYLTVKYGVQHVCSVGTFNRLKLRSALKDLGSVRGLSFDFVNDITKKIDNELEYSFEDLFKYALKDEKDTKLYNLIQNNPDFVQLLKTVLNNPKSEGVHASAVLVLPKVHEGEEVNVDTMLPITEIDGLKISQWEGKYTDAAGFLKEDILGLTQLDKFQNIMRLIKLNHNLEVHPYDLPLDDETVYHRFTKGYTEDVFQFGSFGLKNYCREVMPDCIEDLIAMNALYRPSGISSETHKQYALLKNSKSQSPHFDYGLEEVTGDTFGLLIYQEQIMKACQVLANYTPTESDDIRKIIKKFKKEELFQQKDKFITGALSNGCPPEEAESIWKKILASAGYTFNKCISGDTLIKTEFGDITIAELYKREIPCNLYSYDKGKMVEQPYKEVFKTGIKKVFKLILENGLEIKATPEHKLLVSTGKFIHLANLTRLNSVVCFQPYENVTFIGHKVFSLELVGYEETYDIEMPVIHNYIANNIVTHNSHSCAYALMAYACMWFKVKYPLEFWTTSLNFGDETKDVPHILYEMKDSLSKIEVHKPDINFSEMEFICDPVKNIIYWSLSKIKGVGPVAVNVILDERKARGKFFDFDEFLSRVPKNKVNKGVVRALIIAGAFDELCQLKHEFQRAELMKRYYEITKSDLKDDEIMNSPLINREYYWTTKRRELTGHGDIDHHYLLANTKSVNHLEKSYMDPYKYLDVNTLNKSDRMYTFIGSVKHWKERKYGENKEKKFLIVELDSNDQNIEIIFWNSEYGRFGDVIKKLKEKLVAITGIIRHDSFRRRNAVYAKFNTEIIEI